MTTIQQAGAIITRWADPHGNGFGIPADVSYSFIGSGFAFTAPQEAATRVVMDLWDDVARINFFTDFDDPDITFENYRSEGTNEVAEVTNTGPGQFNPDDTHNLGFNLEKVPTASMNFSFGGYDFFTILHEMGHALGLAHPGEYDANDGDPTYANDRGYDEDTQQYSVMSYFDETETGGRFGAIYSRTLLLHDIAAMQIFYGANMATRTENTTYGFNATAGAAYTLSAPTEQAVFCIWDAGGNDTLDVSRYRDNQVINLQPGRFSSTGGLTFNMSMADAVDTAGNNSWETGFNPNAIANYIENARGGSGNDTIIGNAADNLLAGGAGADRLDGFAGHDTALYDSSVGEAIIITPEGPAVQGRWIVTGAAQAFGDVLRGIEGFRFGSGNDHITLRNGVGTTTLTVDGGDGNDSIIGNPNAADTDILIGGQGNDTLAPGHGKFFVYGGAPGAIPGTWVESPTDSDILRLDRSLWTTQYIWELAFNVGSHGLYQGTDGSTARGIAHIDYRGGSGQDIVLTGAGNDTIRGNDGDDSIRGGLGNDLIEGGLGFNNINGGEGNDTIIGGAGVDWILAGNNGDDRIDTGGGGGDARGEAGNDTLISSDDGEFLDGGTENDVLRGNGGSDLLWGGLGDDTIVGGEGNDTIVSGLGIETLDGGTGINVLTMERAAMTLGVSFNLNGPAGSDGTRAWNFALMFYTGGSGNDTIRGSAGSDTIHGGLGHDLIEGGLGFNNINGGEGNDTIRGGAGDDWVLVGNNGDDRIETGGGGDEARGEAGNDTLISTDDSELLDGGTENDVLRGNGGNDVLWGGAGRATTPSSVARAMTRSSRAPGPMMSMAGWG